jgi:Ser/Thr protein kinase RdoA (MazF antagonist)
MGTGTEALRVTESARIALRDFGIKQARLTHLASRHNDVFRVVVPSGKSYVLRLQNDLMSDARAASQLLWLESLREESGVRVPTPVRTADEKSFTHVSAANRRRRAVLLHWLPGKTARARSDETYFSAAAMIARMHAHAETFRPGRGFSCRTLDDKFLFGDRFFVRSPAAGNH